MRSPWAIRCQIYKCRSDSKKLRFIRKYHRIGDEPQEGHRKNAPQFRVLETNILRTYSAFECPETVAQKSNTFGTALAWIWRDTLIYGSRSDPAERQILIAINIGDRDD